MDIFCVANIEKFLSSIFARLLSRLGTYSKRTSEAVEVVRKENRASGTLISWEYFVEVYLQERWEKQYGDDAVYGR